MRKIAIFMSSFSGGGMERAMLNLAKFFVDEGAEVDLIVASTKGPLLTEVPSKVNIVDLKKNYPSTVTWRLWFLKSSFYIEPRFLILAFARKLPKALKVIPSLIAYMQRKAPDVILSTPTTANLALIWASEYCKFNGKVLVREASTLSKELENKDSIFFRLTKSLVRKWYNRASTVICVSDGVKNDLHDNFFVKNEKMETIYNILDIEGIKSKSRSRQYNKLINKFGDYILSIGRLEQEKNYEMLIRAFHLISHDVSENLVILGEGSKRQSLESLIESLALKDRVFLPGYFINPYPFLLGCRVFALASQWEGCPNVLREARVLNKNIISTDKPSGVIELLKNKSCEKLVCDDVRLYSDELKKLVEQDECNAKGLSDESSIQSTSILKYMGIVLGK